MKQQLDLSRPIEWVNGIGSRLPARLVCSDRKGAVFPIVVLVDHGDHENITTVTADGFQSPGVLLPRIENARRFVWRNIYYAHGSTTELRLGHYDFESKEAAVAGGGSSIIVDTVKITINPAA